MIVDLLASRDSQNTAYIVCDKWRALRSTRSRAVVLLYASFVSERQTAKGLCILNCAW